MFEESAIKVGVCIKATNKASVGVVDFYYLITGEKQNDGSYPCKAWSVSDHQIIQNGESFNLTDVYLYGNQMICSICDNPPSFVHM